MNEAIIPNWIKERAAQEARANGKNSLDAARHEAFSMKARMEGPELWRQLLVELELNVSALFEKMRVRGRVSNLDDSQGQEKRCRIDVVRAGAVTRITYTDLFYLTGDSKIRSMTRDGDALSYEFCLNGQALALLPGDEFEVKTAREVAESLVVRMLDEVSEAL